MGAAIYCSAQTSHCGGVSSCGAQALHMQASIVVALGLSSGSSQTLVAQ